MRASILLTGALALLADASPYANECKNALKNCPHAKQDCSSLLRTTITPSQKLATKTITSKKTMTRTVTSTIATVTHTDTVTTATSTVTVTSEIHASSTEVVRERDVAGGLAIPRGLSPKVTKLPDYARKHCKDTKEYAAACSAIGVKPTFTALPQKTIMYTRTGFATVTATATKSATKTVTVTSTQSVVATVTSLGGTCQNAWLLADGYGYGRVQRFGTGPNDFEYEFIAASEETAESQEMFWLSDNGQSSGYLLTNDADGNGLLAYTHTSSVSRIYDVDVDILDWTTDYTNDTLHTLTCGQTNIHSTIDYVCTSAARATGTRDQFYHCTWPSGVNLPPLALGPADHSSKYCTPVTVKTGNCQQR